jgi:hypothetical protein
MASSLVNPLSFQLNDTGVVLNDDTIIGIPFVDITQVSGLDNAPYRETKRDHEGTDGGFLDAEFETGRDITLVGTVYGNGFDLETYLDSLKYNYGPVQTPIPFYYITENGSRRLLFVKPRGCRYDWTTARRMSMTPVQFTMYAEDPRIYDVNQQSITFPIGGVVTTGFSFNLIFNLSFGGVSAGTDGTFVTNFGNRPTPAIFTISGPMDTPTIVNDTTGDQLQFNIVLAVGDVLVVDTANHTVRLNGNTNRRNTLVQPNWFMLSPGQTFLRFRATSGSGNMVLTFRSAWR